MFETVGQLREIYLQPGELHFARKPLIMRTLLGSCLGVTFWSARLRAGGLCHALLPRCPTNGMGDLNSAAGRQYVDFAIRDLARQFDRAGARRSEVHVKLFGGADVLPVAAAGCLRQTIGQQNCAVATEVLRAEGFEVMAASLGGTVGRSIEFNTATGEVRLRWLTQASCAKPLDG